MARKTFISYKYSEAQDLRDDILDALGEDATYYQGETADSPDLTDTSTENIKKNLTDMMYDTSVTIVVVSPNLKASKWIDWEIEYSLKEISRKGRTSKTNGVVGVIQKINGEYDWLVTKSKKDDGCSVRTIDEQQIRNKVKAKYKGKFLVIDIETGEYEVDADDLMTTKRLLAKRPDAILYGLRIGFLTPYQIGGHFSVGVNDNWN